MFEKVLLIATISAVVAWIYNRFVFQKKHPDTEPWWVKYLANNAWVLVAVIAFRAFAYQPFVIPSLSMAPGLLVSDYVGVSMHSYWLRTPIFGGTLVTLNAPQRGDVIVFKHPHLPDVDYIKRIAAVPGDVVTYRAKRLYVNSQALPIRDTGEYQNTDRDYKSARFEEQNGAVSYPIILSSEAPGFPKSSEFKKQDGCEYFEDGLTCKVPAASYFVLGDSRDDSLDSRTWGFVPEANIYGKAVHLLFSPKDLSRAGKAF